MATSRPAASSTGSNPPPAGWPPPEPGDIVWRGFPNRDPVDPTLKSRPALVLSVMDDASPVRVRVAYGTTQRPRPFGRGEFIISEPSHIAQAGLASETKFSLRNMVILDWTPVWFGRAPRGCGRYAATPVMGTLPSVLVQEVQRARRELQPPS